MSEFCLSILEFRQKLVNSQDLYVACLYKSQKNEQKYLTVFRDMIA